MTTDQAIDILVRVRARGFAPQFVENVAQQIQIPVIGKASGGGGVLTGSAGILGANGAGAGGGVFNTDL